MLGQFADIRNASAVGIFTPDSGEYLCLTVKLSATQPRKSSSSGRLRDGLYLVSNVRVTTRSSPERIRFPHDVEAQRYRPR
jgi:hypothetical protein